MEHQILVAVRRYAPVEPPFEHRKSLVEGKRLKRQIAIEEEMRLRLQPAAQVAGPAYANAEIGEAFCGVVGGVLRVEQ